MACVIVIVYILSVSIYTAYDLWQENQRLKTETEKRDWSWVDLNQATETTEFKDILVMANEIAYSIGELAILYECEATGCAGEDMAVPGVVKFSYYIYTFSETNGHEWKSIDAFCDNNEKKFTGMRVDQIKDAPRYDELWTDEQIEQAFHTLLRARERIISEKMQKSDGKIVASFQLRATEHTGRLVVYEAIDKIGEKGTYTHYEFLDAIDIPL